LKKIVAENNLLRQQAQSASKTHAQSAAHNAELAHMPELEDNADSNVANPLFDETVRFVDEGDGSKRTYVGEAATATFETRIRQMINGDQTSSSSSGSLYFKDRGLLRVGSSRYQLPNRTYAILLVQTLLRFIGANYHLMTEKSFLKKLDETYAGQHLEAVWLARLFVIFALGELYLNKTPTGSDGATVPGTQFFLQATALFPDLYEEVDLAYIETLVGMVYQMAHR
jgi:proline utilization trans-activator